ncbi:MAG: SDR family NAD(P)-dependent oxidoreductase [Pseudomonadota bacterium]|jgi:O-antigen biosynthesis protein WbqV
MNRLRSLTWRNLLIAVHDVLATLCAVVASFYLRFEGESLSERIPLLLQIIPYFAILTIVVCYVFSLTTTKWRFISIPDLLNIMRVATVLSVALLVLDYVFVAPNVYGAFFFGKTTIIIYWFLEVAFLSALRLAYRYFRYVRTLTHARAGSAGPAILIGRAADAELFLRAIESGAIKNLSPVGLLSPSRADRGQSLRGIAVLGGIDDLSDVVADFARRDKQIDRVVMLPSAFEQEANPESLLTRARRLGLSVSRLPTLQDSGETLRLAPVAVEDLLLRPSVKIEYQRLKSFVSGRSVVITGGGGSIGLEICDRVATFGASRLLVIEHSEPALHAALEILTAKFPHTAIEGRIADIRDRDRIFRLLSQFKPDIVFHCAALKHVPILERDWAEGVKTNVFGTVNVADAAIAADATAMVMISTDKAIEPVSMLGLTKRFAEMYCQALDRRLARDQSQMRLISVRFGNVLASNGSVVPKFKSQIESGGPVTVTHPEMVRYFMTIREACDLVVTAAAHAFQPDRPDVSVYVLNMGQPVKIVDLADRMIRLSGLQPGYDIEIVFTGARPGERLNEILFASDEPSTDVGIAGIVAARPNEPPLGSLQLWLAALEKAVAAEDRGMIENVLKDAVPEFRAGRD